MQASPECIPYALSQVLVTARLVTEDEWIHRKVLTRVLADLATETNTERSAPELIFSTMVTAYKALGVKDPYENEKLRLNKAIQALDSDFRTQLNLVENSLQLILRLAVAGCVINREIADRIAAEKVLQQAISDDLAIDNCENLLRSLTRANKVLYILNNSGEAVLDKIFITELAKDKEVIVVVRSEPILNDVTLEDAAKLGFNEIKNVKIIDPGAAMLGIWLEKSNKQFCQAFKEADLVICKGQDNFESLEHVEREVFFLLCAHNQSIAKRLQIAQGSQIVLQHTQTSKSSSSTTSIRKKKL